MTGEFGVGFYLAHLASDKVRVVSFMTEFEESVRGQIRQDGDGLI